MSIASSVLEAVRAEAALHGGGRVARVGLRIGEMSGVEPESLRFCMEALVKDTGLAPLALDIEMRPLTSRCRACGSEFAVVDYHFACTACGSPDTATAGGAELELAYLEMEDDA
jgi:hydrogenase nickel incorporation protein HypA/HybF